MATPRRSALSSRRGRQFQQRQSQRTSLALILAGIGLLAAVYLAFSRTPDNPDLWPISLGKAMPDLALKDLSGNTVRLSDYAGRPVLINAWATWCPPCREEMPLLQVFYNAHQAEGLAFLAINAGEDAATINKFIANNGFSFPVLLDPDADSLYRLGIDSFPTSVLVGRDGTVQAVHIGLLTAASLDQEFTPYLKH
jgi:thiol-disulfide isomerase/thioredoxin